MEVFALLRHIYTVLDENQLKATIVATYAVLLC